MYQQDIEQDFSDIVDQFLSRYCRLGSGLNISDRTLFPEFRAFWISKAHAALHPSLLGQFRIELAGRGYRSNGWKIPRWYGLALQGNGVRSDKADERQKAEEAI